MSESFDKVDYSAQKAASLAKLANYGSAAQDAYAMRAAQNHDRAKAIRQSLRAEHQPTAGPYQQWNDPDAIYRDGERGHAVQEFNRLSHQPWNSGATELYHTNAMEAAFGRAYAGLDDWMTAAAAENAADAARRGGGGGWGGGGWGGGGGGGLPDPLEDTDVTTDENKGGARVKTDKDTGVLWYKGQDMHVEDVAGNDAKTVLNDWWMATAPDHYKELTDQFEQDRNDWATVDVPLGPNGKRITGMDLALNVAAEARHNGAGPAEVKDLLEQELDALVFTAAQDDELRAALGDEFVDLLTTERDKETNFASDPRDNLIHHALHAVFPIETWEGMDESDMYALKLAAKPDGGWTTLGDKMQKDRSYEAKLEEELQARALDEARAMIQENPDLPGEYGLETVDDLAGASMYGGEDTVDEALAQQLAEQQAFQQMLARQWEEEQQRQALEKARWEAQQAEYERLAQQAAAEQAYREAIFRAGRKEEGPETHAYYGTRH